MSVVEIILALIAVAWFVLFHLYVFKIERELYETKAELKKHIESEVESNV